MSQLHAPVPARMTELVPPPRDPARSAGTALITGGALAAAVGTAAAAQAWATFVLLALSALAEARLDADAFARWLRRHAGAGMVATTATRGVLLTLAAARTTSTAVTVGAAVTAVVAAALAGAAEAARLAVDRERRPPVITRNVPLDVDVPRAPARLATRWLLVSAMPVAAIAVAVGRHSAAAAVLLAVATALASVAPAGESWQLLMLRRRRVRPAVADTATRRMAEQQPRVLLYFAGAPEEVYQLDMWLEPVERCGVPAAVIVRDPEVLRRVAPTSLPIYCVEHNGTMASLPLPPRVATLFPTHSGNNLAMLRRPEAVRIFVGHGDSDKADSSNPFARVYDEIWVAGPAARERYVRAGVGVRADAIVEVGRPQLPQEWPTPPAPLTVLYAPTWEGWGNDPHHTSLPHVGVALVRALLDAGVRVMYRPHPLTGVRSADVRRAHDAIVAALRAAGAPAGHREPLPVDASGDGDLLAVAISTGAHPWSRVDGDRLVAKWTADYWAASPSAPRILTPPAPDLHACFTVAHALVTDVSSVASDWLATGRAYAVADTRPLGTVELRRCYPVTAAAYVLSSELREIAELLAAARGDDDPLRDARQQLREQVLGTSGPAAFATALARVRG